MKRQTVNEWADDNVILPPDSAAPGRYRSDLTPYVVPLGDAISSGEYKRVIGVMMAQGGKSKTMENAVGWKLDTDPEPVLYIGPTHKNLSEVVEPKLDDMIRRCESLSKKTLFNQSYKKKQKNVNGTTLRLASAGSTTEIKAASASLVLVDEIDEITIEIKGQGSIIPLADARHKTYHNGLTVAVSTCTKGTVKAEVHPETGFEHWAPSNKLQSAIWKLWQGGTRHEWAVPCPHCDEYFIPRFKLLKWPNDATAVSVRKTAYIACPNNGCIIENGEREDMNARGVPISPGQWVEDGEVMGEGIDSPDFSLWVSGLANPFISLGRMASNWLRAVRSHDDEAIMGVLNTDMGELYNDGGEAPSEDKVKACKAAYMSGEVPEDARTIVIGVDVQKNRLEYVVRAFGYQYESSLIEEGEIYGDTSQPEVWDELEDFTNQDFGHLEPRLVMVDSGYNTQQVYEFVRRDKTRYRATKGHDTQDKPYYQSLVDVTPAKGKTIRKGVKLWHFNADVMKTWVHGRINRDKSLPGQWRLPGDVSDDYCKQITAEERVDKASGGVMWLKVHKDNHKLDCEALAYLGALMLKSLLMRKPVDDTPEDVVEETTPAKRISTARKINRMRRGNKPAWRTR